MPTHDRYASFLLRLQRAQNDDCPTWLASIQSTKTGESRWFPDLDGLIQFFREEFGDSAHKTETAALPENDNHEPKNRQIDTKAGE